MSDPAPPLRTRLRRRLVGLATVPVGLVAVWLATMEMPVSAGAMIVATVLVAISSWRGCIARVVQLVGGSIWLVGAAVCFWVPLHEADASMARWQADLDAGHPLAAHRLVGAYGLHLALIPAGVLAGFPEATWEVVALHIGGDGYRWSSDVVLREPAARAVARRWVEDAVAGSRSERSWDFAWKGLYNRQEHSLRAALALNCPMRMTGHPGEDAKGVFVDVDATCHVRWPKRARIPVGRVVGRSLALEEGVFRGLQDAGWLSAVDVTWTVRVRPGDPRLQGSQVQRSWVEALMLQR